MGGDKAKYSSKCKFFSKWFNYQWCGGIVKATRLTFLLATMASLDISKGGKNQIGQTLKAQQNVMDEKKTSNE